MLLHIEEPLAAVSRPVWSGLHPVWALGFRPFYLLAAAFAVLAVPLWLATYLGAVQGWPHVGLGWHMHEMVFGVACAVIVGFLFTAGRNWTGLWTPRRGQLAALALLWVAGRIAMLAAPAGMAALVDLLFLLAAAYAMARVLLQSGNTRNLPLAGLLTLLALANMVFHAATLGWLPLSPVAPVQAAIFLVVLIESVIGGRVIPMFTNNGVPGAGAVVHPERDKTALVLAATAAVCWIAGLRDWPMAALGCAAGMASLWRQSSWRAQRTLRTPLLWILHAGYAWVGVGLVLVGLAAIGIGTASTAFHALAVGSMGALVVGMMTRTTLGHTGRLLRAGGAEAAMYALVLAAALLRLLAGFVPDWRNAALVGAALCWSLSFAGFLLIYTPYLWRARVDGKEG